MSEVSPEQAFDRAVDLVINQDKTVQFWTGRFIAVQSALVVAEAALLAWRGTDSGWLVPGLGVLLGLVAISLVVAMTAIIVRQCQWQQDYVEMVKRAEVSSPLLYQEGHRIPGANIPTIFVYLRFFLVVAWVVFLSLLVFTKTMA